MKPQHPYVKQSCIAFFLLFTTQWVVAQLRADFIPDKTGGCSPLAVSFSNSTGGASANAEYKWDFGNGNTSALKNPSAIFYSEKVYNVTLTVKDGAQTSVKSKTITVSKRPIPDFTISANKGCLPFSVAFNNTSAAGDGSIVSCHWDFGDGSTQKSANTSINHVYNFPQTASVTLTATNNYGCTETITKSNIITVLPSVQANFHAQKNLYCEITDEVKFINNSSGPGTLSFEWDFGDNTTSTLKSPSHTYNKKGTFAVKLTVKSSEGCIDARTISLPIANFNSDFSIPQLICTNTVSVLNNTTRPVSDYSTWLIDGINSYSTYGNEQLSISFLSPGIHTIQLTNNFAQCSETISKQVDVKPSPVIKGFIADISSLCGAPSTVKFKDTTAGTIKWLWNFFYNGPNSDLKEPSYTYTRDDLHYVTLTVTNSEGCSNTINQNVYIGKPLVGIFIADNNPNAACGSITKKFTTRFTEPISTYAWDFGDGDISSDAEPEHTFTKEGTFTIHLKYVTQNGCTGTAEYSSVIVSQKHTADLSVLSGTTICGNTPVSFTLSGGYGHYNNWDFGDGSGDQSAVNNTVVHQYQKDSLYTIKVMFAYDQWGLCRDTIIKKDLIKVLPPFPRISSVQNTCDGDRGLVSFSDASYKANSWSWDFGDGSKLNYSSVQTQVTHHYSKTGKYKIILSTTNGQCTVRDSATAYVLLKQKPVLTLNAGNGCVNGLATLAVSNMETNPAPNAYFWYGNYYNLSSMQYEDGSNYNGPPYQTGVWQNTNYWSVANMDDTKKNIRVISSSAFFECRDTSNAIAIPLLSKAPVAKFRVNSACFNQPYIFEDLSTAAGVPIKKWEWDFGDGQAQTLSNNSPATHQYNRPGYYYVVLKVTDANGCFSSTPYYANQVVVEGPLASFSPSGTNVPLNTTVLFSNTTISFSQHIQYKWDFGDGSSSTDFSPAHTYSTTGTYTVTLIAANVQTQCIDSIKQVIIVRNFNYAFSMNSSFIGDNGNCAPALVKFTNTSSNYTRIVWDFGDGFTLQDQNFPSHIYKNAGKYYVTLYVYGFNGLTGIYKDSINIGASSATVKADITEGCKGLRVTLHAPAHTNTQFYTWDFGDGSVLHTKDSFAVNKYNAAGTYSPTLIAADQYGCSVSVPLGNKIIINPDPVITVNPTDATLCKGNSVQLTAGGGVSYTWSPADGLDKNSISSPVASPTSTTTYTVAAKNNKGCTGDNHVTISVAQPFAMQTSPDAGICAGTTIQLTSTGADSYKWINETTNLNDLNIPDPIASPLSTLTYTVVGYDKYHCFTDTGFVTVTVHPQPTVHAGQDMEIIIGSEVQLNAVASSDVTRWTWSPSDYLGCIDCPSPLSRPRAPIDYTVTVQNEFNCIAKDNIKINTLCAGGQIYIPSAFSPNGDGKNDRFIILGKGVRIIKSLRIYNRWGNLVFEKKNYYPDDNSASWDGRYYGADVPAGSYVFIAEMECSASETFTRKGTVTLIR